MPANVSKLDRVSFGRRWLCVGVTFVESDSELPNGNRISDGNFMIDFRESYAFPTITTQFISNTPDSIKPLDFMSIARDAESQRKIVQRSLKISGAVAGFSFGWD